MGAEIRAVKVITYDSEGNKMVFKYGDPEGKQTLGFSVEYDVETEEVSAGFLETAMIYKTGPQTSKFTIRY